MIPCISAVLNLFVKIYTKLCILCSATDYIVKFALLIAVETLNDV